MRVVIVYRDKSEHRRQVEGFLFDYKRRTGGDIEVVDPDSRDGVSFCKAYDITNYPTIIALGPDGSPYHVWSGDMLPTISEVNAVANI